MVTAYNVENVVVEPLEKEKKENLVVNSQDHNIILELRLSWVGTQENLLFLKSVKTLYVTNYYVIVSSSFVPSYILWVFLKFQNGLFFFDNWVPSWLNFLWFFIN